MAAVMHTQKGRDRVMGNLQGRAMWNEIAFGMGVILRAFLFHRDPGHDWDLRNASFLSIPGCQGDSDKKLDFRKGHGCHARRPRGFHDGASVERCVIALASAQCSYLRSSCRRRWANRLAGPGHDQPAKKSWDVLIAVQIPTFASRVHAIAGRCIF
jgi:hypothetical protein